MLIKPHNPEWVIHFNEIKKKLSYHLVSICIDIEHIGGTSIVGLSAKPIIDLDIVYYDANEFEKIKTILEDAGYQHNGNQGIVGREVFKRNKMNYDKVLDEITHHLYVCMFNSEELQKHLLFRDYLRLNNEVKLMYQNLKYDIANEANNDKKVYATLKEVKAKAFINQVIEQAKIDSRKE
jgi:GrpB-like predicted nucleotidyltransferase (UPF0157 family)